MVEIVYEKSSSSCTIGVSVMSQDMEELEWKGNRAHLSCGTPLKQKATVFLYHSLWLLLRDSSQFPVLFFFFSGIFPSSHLGWWWGLTKYRERTVSTRVVESWAGLKLLWWLWFCMCKVAVFSNTAALLMMGLGHIKSLSGNESRLTWQHPNATWTKFKQHKLLY